MKKIAALALAGLVVLGLAACTSDQRTGQQAAQDVAKNRQVYVPKNDVEGRNYNARQTLADNPSTLIWCTAFPTNPNVKPFTIAVVGKLTSGNKRPFPTEQTAKSADVGWYNPELPGPDGFYGTSGEYRYGFDPAGNYVDFYNLETFCTNVPDVMQRNTTIIQIKPGTDVTALDAQIEAALKACRAKDPDPSHACPAAVALLGGA